MHIKQVIISGFRSFRSQSEIEPFSPKHNVIVGRNGSGKSNFFDAIQFVLLGPKFASLRQEDRQHLLHEGAGSSVMAAYVEIIFDNSDGRLSVESDEVVLRRTVGHKKDEFFLNRKRVQKSEVQSLLESAGFSKSNPYYIVQQGKVANLCVMKDEDRLNLLKEVAGTTVYEERRSESIRIMQETSNKQEQIMEVLNFIEERLRELETEKEELTEYEQLDKHRRALEYNLYDKELSKASEQLGQIEVVREEEREKQQDLHARLRTIQDELQVEEESVSAAKQSLERLIARREEKALDLAQIHARRSAIEVELQETEASARAQVVEKKSIVEQLSEVTDLIVQSEAELARIGPEFDERSAGLLSVQEEAARLGSRVEALYGKQGRGRQFTSKADRDAFLQVQIESLNATIAGKQTLLGRTRGEVLAEETKLQREKDSLVKAEHENTARGVRNDELTKILLDRTQDRNELQEQRKNCWRQLEQFQEQLQEAKHALEKGKQQLNSSLPRSITQGLATVERIAEEEGLRGYYGPLIDNIRLKNDAYRTAVEVAAGNSLFHVIVDTDTTAAYLMKELERRKAGRLTFLPLNRLRNPDVQYPDSTEVHSLTLVALEYEPQMEQAIRQVFGKKLLARDLDTAAHFSKEFQLDAITTDGDQVNRKGGFEGGYHDERVSRIRAVVKIREANNKIALLDQEESVLKKRSEAADAAVNESLRELQKLETEREHTKGNAGQVLKELSVRAKHVAAAELALQGRREESVALSRETLLAQQQVTEYQQEQKTALKDKLSEKERQELRTLSEREKVLQGDLSAREQDLMVITESMDKLRADLKSNLMKRRDELTARLAMGGVGGGGMEDDGMGTGDLEGEMQIKRVERDHIISQMAAAEAELSTVESQLEKRRIESSRLEKKAEAGRVEEQAAQVEMGDASKSQDRLLNKRTMLMETVSQKQHMIRDLGTLPRKELEEFKSLGEKQVLKRLKEVNENLKKYASVNRKALDQYVSFNEQRENLVGRKEELIRDTSAIEQLVQSLDSQKEEAILRTFRGVSHHFSEVFSELVPGGEGKLVMRTTGDEVTGGEEVEGTDLSLSTGPQSMTLSVFHGVQVRVTFSATGQQFDMQQLSGGQKALVALALIFAIQRCDPAPFYLFDEIDQALDANYRAGVARLIQKQVNSPDAPAQFITTTFRPELVEVASKCYGIALINKVSNIYPLDKSDAQDFVTNLMNEEEAVGQVVSVPAFSRLNRQTEEVSERGSERPSASKARPPQGAVAGVVGRRRPRDTTDDESEEEEEAMPEDDDDDDGGDGDDGGLSELQDVDGIGAVSIGASSGSQTGQSRGRGRAGVSSTSVGVGSGRVQRGSFQEDEEDEDHEDENDKKDSNEGDDIDAEGDASLFADSPLLQKRGSSVSKSQGSRRPFVRKRGSR